jgi:5'-nucleotidase
VNLNVPALLPEDVGDVRVAALDRFGSVRAVVASSTDGLEFEFRSTGAELDPASDTALLADGHPTVTALDGLAQTALDGVPTRADLIESRVTRAR